MVFFNHLTSAGSYAHAFHVAAIVLFAQTLAVNTPSRAALAAVGLTFARAFVSGDPYDDLVPGAEQGEVEYEITRSTWQQRHCGTGP